MKKTAKIFMWASMLAVVLTGLSGCVAVGPVPPGPRPLPGYGPAPVYRPFRPAPVGPGRPIFGALGGFRGGPPGPRPF